MADPFVLTMLSRPIVIGGCDHMVAWDVSMNRVVVMHIVEDGTQLEEMKDDNNNEMSFGSELDAHRYLLGLKVEKDGWDPKDASWTKILD